MLHPIFRYGLYDFEYTHQCQGTTEASKKEKLFLMSWCPDRYKEILFTKINVKDFNN